MMNASRLSLLSLLLLPASASAQECPPDHVGCHTEAVDFEHRDALSDDVMFDTGWQPAGAPIQVRFALFAGAATVVDMGGTSVTSWPPPLNESVAGRPGSGRFSFNYGIEVVARLRFDVTVAGARYTWEGDIPIPGGVPPDLRLAAEMTFDPFVLPPSEPRPISVMDMTGTVPLFDLPLTDALIPIPGISGGFAVEGVAMLEGFYRTNTIEVNDALTMIETEGASVVVRADMGAAGLGGAKDLVITPHGTITYAGMVTLTPLVYIEILGRRFDVAIADIPIPIPAFDSETDFTPAEVHVPLPDIRIDPRRLMFERTSVGGTDAQLLTINNDGEATLEVEIRDPASPYFVATGTISVPPSSSQRVEVRFEPTLDGDRNGVLFLASNDPDEPLVTVQLSGTAFGGMPDAGIGDAGLGGPMDGGCGCRTASRDGRGAAPLGLVGLGGLLLLSRARRRRRRSARAPR